MKLHRVKSDDNLLTIAAQYGICKWEDIYNHQANKRLREYRPDPMCLKEGDVVYIPDTEPMSYQLATDQKHVIIVQIPKTEINLLIRFNDQDVLANTRYRLRNGGLIIENQTDGQGILKEKVPSHIKSLDATFFPTDGPEISLEIAVGRLDADSEISGLQQRLTNLGYYNSAVDDEFGELTHAAITEFQMDHDIDPSEGINDKTISLINKIYHNQS